MPFSISRLRKLIRSTLSDAKIKPGEYYVTPREMMIVTVLGSCVSACIRDRQRGIGGMNHFMLPTEDSSSDICSASARVAASCVNAIASSASA